MSCTLRFPNSNVANALRKITGSNDRLYASYLSKTVKGGELTKDFVEWYQARHPRAKEVTTDASEAVARNIAKGMVEYYNYFVPDGRTTVRQQSDNKAVFYDSVASRKLGKRISAGIMLRGYNQFANVKHDKSKLQTREDYEKFVEFNIRSIIIKNIATKTGASAENIKKEYLRKKKSSDAEAFQYIVSLTEGMELSLQEENQLALLREVLTDTKAYFDEVFKDSRLSSLIFKKSEDDISEEEKAAMNAEASEDSKDDDLDVDYFDDSFRVFDSHDGLFKTFETHVDSNIRNYFNGLQKLRSTNTSNGYDVDTNNSLGLGDTMNAAQCVAVMYTSGNYASVDTMIESVRRIANTQPGMEAFIKFADDLEANRDFACEVYRTFAKNVISKTEVTLEGNEMKVRRSNRAADKLDALRMEFLNGSRYNAISVNGELIDIKIDNIGRKVTAFRNKRYRPDQSLQRETDIAEIAKDLADALRMYYPTIDDSTILNYIHGKKVGERIDVGNNIIALGSILRATVKASKDTLTEYKKRQYETAKAKQHNDQLQEIAILENRSVKQSELKDIPSIWAVDYISQGQEQAALALATELVPYSVVKIELNSRNVEGNLSSDVINSSFITNFINTLSSELNAEKGFDTPLAKFGKWKLQGKQYNLSNILVEERDENNRIINYGLFRKEGNNYVPTSYATELISISLFNGASDRNQAKNVLYSKMSTGDYIATALSSFFNDERTSKAGCKFASYFMRTPSDAPKNFLVSAPRYFTKDLIKDGKFNHNHIVFRQYRRIVRQEITNAVQALELIFEVNNGVVRLDNDGKPVLNKDIDKHNLYKNYHYNGEIVEPVKDDNGVILYWRLTGNVFKSTKLTYVDNNGVQHNFIQELINSNPTTESGINFLYGGAKGNPFVFDTDGNVIISDELQDAIDGKIEEFITALVADGKSRIHKFDELLKADPKEDNIRYSEDDLQDFMINYHLMYNNFDDLFEGDAKFYGTAQDFLKRAKEVQASGVPYANEENEVFGDVYDGVRHQIDDKHSVIENEDFADIRSKLHNMHLFDKFTGVTVKNTVKQDPMTMPDGVLSKQLQEAGLSRERANEMMKGYAKTKVNDAQSYITFEEWVRRVALRGQLYKYKPLIEAILDESKPLTVSQINEFIQVQKNFYYDQYFDAKTGVIVPRQIKNAEFVLVPRFIKGTELEQVYNAMIYAGVDQLNTEETSKAGKARVLTLWNEDGVLDKKAIDKFTKDAKKDFELFDYKHLYTQQETPQHVAAQNKAGIQIMKKILDNIDANSSPKLKALKDKFIDNFCANIQDSYETLCDEIGIELDENGNVQLNSDGTIKGLDYSKLSEKFVDELNRLGATSQMYDFVEMEKNSGVTKMPPYLNSIYYKLQNISQSIFNNSVTRQKLPGFHAAQITQVGFRPFSEKINKREYSSALQYHPQLFEDSEGNEIPEREYIKLSAEEQKKYKKGRVAPYIEIMLPKSNFGLSHLSNEEALKQLQEAGVDEIIGYRIPTEGKQSICVMKVVDFTDDAQGSTIVVPDGWVAQTGSDFDIDSVYGIHFETYLDKNGNLHKIENTSSDREHYNNYIINKLREVDTDGLDDIRSQTEREVNDISAEEAHKEYETSIDHYAEKNNLPTFDEFVKTKLRRRKRAARNNGMLESMIGILQDPAMLEENLSRSNSDDLEDALNSVLPQTFKNRRLGRSQYNFLDQADYQSDVMSGAALKGFSVTRDTMCSVSNAVHPTLDDNNALFIKYLDGRRVKHSRFGWSEKGEYGNKDSNKNIDGRLITVYSSETTAFILDAVKKGAIPNVNDLTFSTFKTFVDLGSNYNLAVAFIGQPAITRIVEAFHKGNSIYSQDTKKPVDEAIMSIARELGYKDEKITARKALDFINKNKNFTAKVNAYLGRGNKELTGRPDDIEHTYIDESKLISRINETGEFSRPVEGISEDQLAFDLATVLTFNKISKLSNQLTSMAMVLNPDKFGAKQTIYATRKVFDDIADIIINDRCPLKVEKDGKRISMLEAIYPGVVVGTGNGSRQASLDYFLQNKGKSAYPSLYTFLKYVTAPSIKINQTLFKTQSDFFVDRIKSIQAVFSGKSTKVTEDRYDDVERYYLGYFYNQLETLRSATVCIVDENGKVKEFRNTTDISEQDERARVAGFNRTADLSVEYKDTDGETYLKPFTVKDINKPTQDEVNDFAKLSPAQKVAWVQQNFRDSVVCAYYKVDLSNRSQTYNTQTVRYIENNVDIETVFQDFLDTFNNENPFLAMTAMDLIKYAFVVEGYRMSKQAVNKTIPNDVLYNSMGIDGSGIISQLRDKMFNPEDTLTDEAVDKLQTRYVRSHMNIPEIGHTYIGKKEGQYFKNIGQYVYLVSDADTIVRKQLGYKEYDENIGREVIRFNKFVTIKGTKTTNLYKIVPFGESCLLYPLNKLETSETTEWSANVSNNKFPSEDFYVNFIRNQVDLGFDATRFMTQINEEVKSKPEYTFQKPKVVKSKEATPDFDINDARTYTNLTNYANSVKQAAEIIDEHFALGSKDTFYFNNQGLRDIIKEPVNRGINKAGGTLQIINGKQYHIYKAMHKPEGATRASEFIAVDLEEDFANLGSSIEEVVAQSTADAIRESKEKGTEESETLKHQVENAGAVATTDSAKVHMDTLLSSIAQYLTTKKEKLIDGERGINMFYKNPETGEYYAMNDPRLGELLRTNSNLRRQFIKTILEAKSIINKYKEYNEFDITSEDLDMKNNLDKIKKVVRELEDNIILREAEQLYVNEYLKKISNNPLIKQDIISILDGYHSTSAIEAYIHDLQETGSPLLQVITKDVMSNIRAAEMQAQRDVSKFRSKLAEIKAKAKANGHTVDWNKIVDDNGRIIREYSEQLKEDLNSIREEVESAKETYGLGSIEHLKAKLKYDKFVLKNFNQELPDDYYSRKIDYEEKMITKFPAIYSKYKKLTYELSDVLSHTINGELDPAYEARRVAINREIQSLRSNVIVHSDGSFTLKGEVNTPNPTQDQLANSLSSANALKQFMSDMTGLREEYYEYTDKFGFEELLEQNLDIIRNAETDAAQGRTNLANNQAYKKAKEWLHKNARYVYDFNPTSLKDLSKAELEAVINGDDSEENLPLKAQAAVRWLFMDGTGTRPKPQLTSSYANAHDAYDERGAVDARKFTDEEIDKIKKEQEDRAKAKRQGILDEGAIISSVPAGDTIYNSKFWSKVSSHGMPNQEYLKVVKDINDILRKAYDKRVGVLRTSMLSDEDIQDLITLMEKLGYKNGEFNVKDRNRIKRKKGVTKQEAKETADFIKNYCESNPNMSAFRAEEQAARNRGNVYYSRWCDLNYEWVEGDDGLFNKVPNRLLWGGIKLKDSVPENIKKEYIDVTRTNAMRVLNEFYETKPNEYYYKALKEASDKGEDYFNDWWNRNHVYNTYTHIFEPIECWIERTPNDNFPGHYEASFNAKTRNPIERNKYYRPGLGHLANYKTKKQREEMKNAPVDETDELLGIVKPLHIPDGTYDNPIELNDEEKEVKTYVEALLASLAHNKQSIDYFARGNMPSRAKGEDKDAVFWIKDFLKHFGIVEGNTGRDAYDDNLGDYDNDYIPDMPMTDLLRTKDGEKEASKYKLKKPDKSKYGDDIAKYEADLKAYNEEQNKIKEIREKEHKRVLDRDWESVLEDFILKAEHYNAVQDNKYALYIGESLLKKIGTYQTKYSSTGELKVDRMRSNEDEGEVNYVTKPDKHLLEQYHNWIRRLVFDQFKRQQGVRTNIMSRLQAFTSTNYMTLNIRGGIANVTLGESTILGEAIAKQFFGTKEWIKGKAIWSQGVTSFILGAYKDTSTTLADAIVKAFNVVDFDEIQGNPRELDLAEANERIRNLAFSPQTAGEHFMQNGALFSMLLSHKLVPNPDFNSRDADDKRAWNNTGRAYVAMSETEYMFDADRKALMECMTDEQKQKYEVYLNKIKKDANIARQYAWWRRDIVTDFVNAVFDRNEQKHFAKVREEYQKKAKEEFANYNDLYSQFELGKDGKMAIKQGSDLAKMDFVREGNDISDAYALLGEFKGKVISVNKFIHGVYDKMGAAMLEREWYGAIVMQYHKHIPMGIARFYRRQGYFNEERQNINKGIFASIKDFLSMNVRAVKTRAMLNDEEVNTVEGIQELFKTSLDFITHFKTCYDILPEYEQANIKRSLGYIAGMVSAVCLAIALRCVYDDDDESVVYNLALYEADRLASEAWQFTPPGMYTETKKLFSQPIAAQSIINDAINGMCLTANYIVNGEDADLVFQSGRFAGRNKIGVYVERRIPIWRNIKSITDIQENNHYYKLGDNMLSIIPVKDIAKWIKE